MQIPLYLLSPPVANSKRTDALGLLIVFVLHLLIIASTIWNPAPPLPDAPALAPKVMEASLVIAAPPKPPTELPPEQQQVETTAAPKPVVMTEETQDLLTHKDALTTINDTPKPPEPTQKEIREEVEEEVITEPQEPAQPAPDTTAPAALPAPPAEIATAATTGASQQLTQEVQLNWQQQLQLHLERRKKYPRAAQMRHQEGIPWVKFSMDRSGNVLSVTLTQSSGVDSLDKEAVAMVNRANPLPPPPPEVDGDPITLTVPIEFFIE